MKTLKFKSQLARLIEKGTKTSTWRLFDDKDLAEGNEVAFYEEGSDVSFATAILNEVIEKTLGSLNDADWEGHERFTNEQEMYATYQIYYGSDVGPETVVKLIKFTLK